MTGIHRCVVSRYETGNSTPEIQNLVLRCDALDIHMDPYTLERLLSPKLIEMLRDRVKATLSEGRQHQP